jgi:hypothetical protein
MTLTTYAANRVWGQGDDPDYYIKSLFYNGSNKTLTRVQGRCGCLLSETMMMVATGSLRVTFAGSSAPLVHPKPRWWASGAFVHL